MESRRTVNVNVTVEYALGEGFALALQQVVAGLGALELALHQAQRLARGEDGLSRLGVVSVGGHQWVLHGVKGREGKGSEVTWMGEYRTPLPDMMARWWAEWGCVRVRRPMDSLWGVGCTHKAPANVGCFAVLSSSSSNPR